MYHQSCAASIAVLCLSQSVCLTLCDPMDCSLLGSSVHGILHANTLEWVASPLSSSSSRPRHPTRVCWIAGKYFISWATREAHSICYVPVCWPFSQTLQVTALSLSLEAHRYLFHMTSSMIFLEPQSTKSLPHLMAAFTPHVFRFGWSVCLFSF